MKVEDYRRLKNPTIYIEKSDFTITIENSEVEIEYEWDEGFHGSRGTGRMYIDRKKLIELLQLIEKPIGKKGE